MDLKNVFAGCFLISVLIFTAGILFFRENYIYVAAMHTGLLFLSLFFLYTGDIRGTLRSIGIPGDVKKNIIYTAFGFFSLVLILFAAGAAASIAGINDSEKVIEKAKQLPAYILILSFTFVPLSEEMFFRALLAQRIGIIVSSVVFALSHIAYGSLMQIIGTFCVGLVFAYIYKKSESIVPSISLHIAYNLLSVIMIKGIL